eukprot:Skav229228  [mRNA]  locus=scaffold864:196033:197124:+ [translate_table: standard]
MPFTLPAQHNVLTSLICKALRYFERQANHISWKELDMSQRKVQFLMAREEHAIQEDKDCREKEPAVQGHEATAECR